MPNEGYGLRPFQPRINVQSVDKLFGGDHMLFALSHKLRFVALNIQQISESSVIG
jgi:hypothetical protein